VRRAFWRRSFRNSSPSDAFGLRSTFPRSQSLANSIGSLRSNRSAAKYRPSGEADRRRHRYGSSSLSLDQDALFVTPRYSAALALAIHFGIRRRDRREPAPALAAAPLRLRLARSPSSVSAPAKAPRKKHQREMPPHSFLFLLAPAHNYGYYRCLTDVGHGWGCLP